MPLAVPQMPANMHPKPSVPIPLFTADVGGGGAPASLQQVGKVISNQNGCFGNFFEVMI